MTSVARTVRAPRGPALSCKGWPQEAALRMLMNNLDPEVAERPDDLVVYGGTGRAARSWEAFDAIVATLRDLESDETLVVQSGKPVAVFRTHAWAPRVIIANALLVPAWATWENFRDLEHRGLTMYGQMTAGSWIYIGTQGILQGTYETLASLAQRHFGGDLRGRLVVTAGLGGMGGAQPLAVTMNGGVALVVEVDATRIERRLATRYVDERPTTSSTAVATTFASGSGDGTARSIALLGNAADVLPALVARGVVPDVVTDQTSAHDELEGYVPNGMTLDAARTCGAPTRASTPGSSLARDGRARRRDARRCSGAAPWRSTTATTSARRRGGPAKRRPSTSRASCPSSSARCSARARGRSAGPRCRAIPRTSPPRTAWRSRCSRTTSRCAAGSGWRGERVAFQGLPARIFWLGSGERARFGLAINDLVRRASSRRRS